MLPDPIRAERVCTWMGDDTRVGARSGGARVGEAEAAAGMRGGMEEGAEAAVVALRPCG
jgi:hypothetical protein